MTLGRYFMGVCDSIKELPEHWQVDIEHGFPARIKAVRKDGVSLWYMPQDEVEHERDRARAREERLVKLIHDMYRTLEREDKPYRIYGLHEKLEEYEGRMEAMGIEVD
jgi:hypothetical protein